MATLLDTLFGNSGGSGGMSLELKEDRVKMSLISEGMVFCEDCGVMIVFGLEGNGSNGRNSTISYA